MALLLLLPLLLLAPLAPWYISVPFGILILLGEGWLFVSALKERWRASGGARPFFKYYLKLAGIGILIAAVLFSLVLLFAWSVANFLIP
jgi:hypothetical protein